MIIGLLTLDISIDGSFSLKDKRRTVNRIRDRVGSKFNAAVAEVDDHDLWNCACIGVVTLGNSQPHVNRMLSNILTFVGGLRDCEVEDFQIEFL